MKKNTNMELLRVIACLIVIGCHKTITVSENDIFLYHRVFLKCVFADGVAVFWFLSGCFAFSGGYKKGLVRFFKKVFIPTAVFSVFMYFFYPPLLGDMSLADSFFRSPAEYKEFVINLLRFQNPVAVTPHLWYVYVYAVLVVFFFPVLKAFAGYLDQNSSAEKGFLIVSIIFFLLNDITKNSAWGFSHYGITSAIPAAVLMLWGHVFYKYRHVFERWFFFPLSLILFVALNLVRAKLQMHYYLADGDTFYLYWFTGFGLFAVLSLAVAITSLGKLPRWTERPILFLGKHTFYIYLVHGINLMWILRRMDLGSWIYGKIVSGRPFTMVTAIEYDLSVILIVFLQSLLISMLAFAVTGPGRSRRKKTQK